MTRYILISRPDGALYGDTGRFGAAGDVASPTSAAPLADRRRGRAPRGFGLVPRHSPSACLDVFEMPGGAPRAASPDDADAVAAAHAHGRFVTSLVGYNS